jgi:hypothetical protein
MVKKGNKWNPSKTFRSKFIRITPQQMSCDKISESFKKSKIDYMLVLVSHGGILDQGTRQKLTQPGFISMCDVIFPVRYGATVNTCESPKLLVNIVENFPMKYRNDESDPDQSINGSQLTEALKRGMPKACHRQYDAGTFVPNLEIFAPGLYFGDDDIYLFDIKKREFVKDFMGDNMKRLQLIKTKQTVKRKKKQQPYFEKPIFRTTTKFKKKTKQKKTQPLTLADLCDNNYGTLKNARVKGKSLTNLAVVVVACRGFEDNPLDKPVNSPTSHDYATTSAESAELGTSAQSEMEDLPAALRSDSPDLPAALRGDSPDLPAALHYSPDLQDASPDWRGGPALQEDGYHPWQEGPFRHDDDDDLAGGKRKPRKTYHATKKRRNRK